MSKIRYYGQINPANFVKVKALIISNLKPKNKRNFDYLPTGKLSGVSGRIFDHMGECYLYR